MIWKKASGEREAGSEARTYERPCRKNPLRFMVDRPLEFRSLLHTTRKASVALFFRVISCASYNSERMLLLLLPERLSIRLKLLWSAHHTDTIYTLAVTRLHLLLLSPVFPGSWPYPLSKSGCVILGLNNDRRS